MKKYLSDMWFYVSPKHRNSIIAIKLVKSFIKIAKEVNIAVKLGHVYSGDIERKDNFFKRLGLTKAGIAIYGGHIKWVQCVQVQQ